ncbi:MAG TPA: Fic family protein [Bryobacteraceae bacterium]|nr:Fic family protein [Bryobacteraceae bacterium]
MLTLDPRRLAGLAIPIGTGWLLGACMEARGKQDLWIRQKPEVLEVLREQAIIQSAESSNRIEGVTVAANRLRPLVIGRARPRDRSEEELAGYRAALDWIFSRKNRVAITPDVIRRLHALAQGGSSRFVPVSARKTPAAVDRLCRRYRAASDEERVPPLLIVATFILDLLCIHPFRDGNGRVSRLATSLLLEGQGFQVARYIALERSIEDSKEEYYRVLKQCSQGWHEGKNEIVPWWNYFLGVLRSAYKELERQVESVEARPAKSDLVRRTVLAQLERFTLADMAAQLPSASPQLIKKVLAGMKKAGQVRLAGRGRGARWEVVR